MSALRVGDTVNWRNAWGTAPPAPAKVTDIEVTGGFAEGGQGVAEIDWSEVYGRNVVVTLDNGSWAYGGQIEAVQS